MPIAPIIVLAILFAAFALYGWARARAGEDAGGFVSVSDTGVSVRARKVNSMINWKDIGRIDLARLPSYIDDFCVILVDARDEEVAVYDGYAGFGLFRDEMLRRWPQIESEWARVLNGSPDVTERVTVWKRDGG